MKNLDQLEGEYALKRVQEVAKLNKFNDKYHTLVENLPSMILTSGLGQTLTFLLAGAKKSPQQLDSKDSAEACLFLDISDWLLKEVKIYNSSKDLLTCVVEGSKAEYMAAQYYTLRIVHWLKRLSNAYVKKPTAGETET